MKKKMNKLGDKLGDRPKLYIDLAIDNYVVTRKEDNKQMTANTVKFIQWNENGVGGSLHEEPAVGRSIVLDLTGPESYKWLTSQIVEIISNTEFKTKNSTYMLHKL
jgi:hypothetical protein